MMSATAFAAVMFPSCAARPVSLLVLTGRTITGALMMEPVFDVATKVYCCLLMVMMLLLIGAVSGVCRLGQFGS